MIIALCGNIGSGKDTVANILIEERGFTRMSFAQPLKKAVSAIFNWDYSLVEGLTSESRVWREQVDEWWSKRLGIENLTPRFVLQYIGTNVMRNCFHADIWAASIESHLSTSTGNVVLSDCRFPNELQSIRNSSGIVWEVQGKNVPEWYEIAKSANFGDDLSKQQMVNLNIHESETAWIGQPVDALIKNDGTLEELRTKVLRAYDSVIGKM